MASREAQATPGPIDWSDWSIIDLMAVVYSTYEAKARFSEVIRKVRAGQRIVIAYRGKQIAEIAPIEPKQADLTRLMEELEDQGILSPNRKPVGRMRPLAGRAGVLSRFLKSRE